MCMDNIFPSSIGAAEHFCIMMGKTARVSQGPGWLVIQGSSQGVSACQGACAQALYCVIATEASIETLKLSSDYCVEIELLCHK